MSIDFGSDIYEEPIVAKTFLQEDAQEGSLRPKTLREYIGQEKAKENLSVFIEAARKREEALDHVLLHGPPGLGKTTLAGIIAQEMGAGIRITFRLGNGLAAVAPEECDTIVIAGMGGENIAQILAGAPWTATAATPCCSSPRAGRRRCAASWRSTATP